MSQYTTNSLMEAVYEQLRAVAETRMQEERADHTLQATAIVNEAYLRLKQNGKAHWSGPAEFYAAAAETMRRVLIDHANAHKAAKRGGDRKRVDLTDVVDLAQFGSADDILSIDDAVSRIEAVDAQVGFTIRLRFYAGLTTEQIAAVTGVPYATVRRDWEFARAWLFKELRDE
ncbi:MAG: sigma-70 family RNA polymerase sigma factor [Planctomycetes bacterium]|nr:sigma-70 family RNA polymerase sigma factor [Planctomycetota bacterium]